ncbi:glutathione S-transferase family protein [Rhizobium sp. L1K21]|uniref:glutathione S-transferase family protein n=1 Tax=Rhizobium sp. L1K21 TaxID=2954933 RepID=UPI002092D4D0|nr:glutathione S-transferase [Rhizobium sp. L1K21]MCO6188423.1 glutathione S-transferase [Rhizobium sp. L1K21]
MMTLHWSPRSPFVRKVMIVLKETGQAEEVECVRTTVAMQTPPDPMVLAENPLGKIPTLILEDGRALFDSRVICAHLAERAGMLKPTTPAARLQQAVWEALGDGLTDILLLWRIERLRGDKADADIMAGFEMKVRAVLARLEAESGEIRGMSLGLGHIAIFCALGQLEFRWPGTGWREAFPALAAWYAHIGARPAFSSTEIVDDLPAGDSLPAAFKLTGK